MGLYVMNCVGTTTFTVGAAAKSVRGSNRSKVSFIRESNSCGETDCRVRLV
jgi:hypothetical protein